MPYTKNLTGTQHDIPAKRELFWGTDVTNLLIDIILRLSGTFQAVAASGATAINFLNGHNIRITLNAAATLSFTNPAGGDRYVFLVKNTGAFNITWPGNVKWKSGTAPVITAVSGKKDIIALIYDSVDAEYLGEYAQNY